MKFSDLEDAGGIERIEKDLHDLRTETRELRNEMTAWVRWIIGLQLGAYLLIIGGYFLHK